jgi:hypothetical protein
MKWYDLNRKRNYIKICCGDNANNKKGDLKMLNIELKKLNIPDVLMLENKNRVVTKEQWLKRREEIIQILSNEEYGFLPPPPVEMTAEIIEEEKTFCAGKVTLTKVLIKAQLKQGVFSFPIYCAIPNLDQKYPTFIHINFRNNVPDRYMPTEEICDNGFAVISFCYEDVSLDCNDKFSSGLGKAIYKDGYRRGNECGTLGLWAWAASRVMDYVQTLNNIDKNNIAVVGHSRLGKVALLTGGLDERFAYVFSNDSGCSGAAITRGKTGEHIKDIYGSFPYWFCENYKKYIDKENTLPFDQHFLLALTAPRKLYVSSAQLDSWADPNSEYLSCIAASSVWKLLTGERIVYPDKFPLVGDSFHEGDIGYHLRMGTHYFGRLDWQNFMSFIKQNIDDNTTYQ